MSRRANRTVRSLGRTGASRLDVRATLRSLPAFASTKPGGLPVLAMKNRALGREYELSVVMCGDALARNLNRRYRNKIYSANVLSFPLARNEGELFLNVRAAAREAQRYGTTPRERLALLYVHGLFHLKGLRHGLAMERQERKLLKIFGFQS